MAPSPRVITNGYNDLMPYLRRYFSITPSLSNAASALARVTLYFTVSEFNNLVLASAGTPYSFGSASDLRVSKFPGGGGMAFSGPNNIFIQNNAPGGEMIGAGGYAGSHPNWTTPIFSNYAGNGVDYEVSFTIDEFSTFYIPYRFVLIMKFYLLNWYLLQELILAIKTDWIGLLLLNRILPDLL